MHPYMALNIEECIDKAHLKEKITAVIPTSNSDIEFLMWSVFSLLLRNKPNEMLEHICVNINGPDERTGSTEIQNRKQKFLETLREEEWFHTDNPSISRQMPLTVIRAWSRVGYAESFEMALGWIHTDSYLLMHDDVILLNSNWINEVQNKFYNDPDVAIAYTPPLLGCGVDHSIHRGMYLLRFPQMETTFLLAKKRWIMKAKATWGGFHIPSEDNFLQFELDELPNKEEFLNYNKDLINNPLQSKELYNFIRQEVGAWVYYNLRQLGVKFAELNENNIIHFKQMSNPIAMKTKDEKIQEHKEEIEKLESEILAHPVYSRIYKKYRSKTPCTNTWRLM
jgi:hypothetical protein